MSDTQIKAVIFDLDGTLYFMHPIYRPIFALFCFPNILHLPNYMKVRKHFQGVDLGSGQALHDALCHDFEKGYGVKDADQWIRGTFGKAFLKTLRFMRNRTTEVKQVIDHLRAQGIKVALFSDFGMVHERLKVLGINHEHFDVIVSSEDIGALKPAPRTFMTVADALGEKPENILAVGDRDDTDGEAAKATGIAFLPVDGKSNKNWPDVVKKLLSL